VGTLRNYYDVVLASAGAVVVVAEHNKQPKLGQPHCRQLPRTNSSQTVDTGKDLVFRICKTQDSYLDTCHIDLLEAPAAVMNSFESRNKMECLESVKRALIE
jgi:hypothetical protein